MKMVQRQTCGVRNFRSDGTEVGDSRGRRHGRTRADADEHNTCSGKDEHAEHDRDRSRPA